MSRKQKQKQRLNEELKLFLQTIDDMDPEDEMFNKISEKCVAISSAYLQKRANIGPYSKQNAKQVRFDSCYICSVKLDKTHHFYNRMCISCGTINYTKRFPRMDLTGKTVVVTGGRIKIGFETVVMLLDCGCSVIATTRFADDAVKRYSKHENYENWKDRLHIVQVDLMRHDSIMKLCDYIKKTFPRLDYLINNAAQTLNRPYEFYKHLETDLIEDKDGLIALKCDNFFEHVHTDPRLLHSDRVQMTGAIMADIEKKLKSRPDEMQLVAQADTVLANPEMYQEYVSKYFPVGKYDEHDQQLDLRPINTWTQKLEDVNSSELLQVLLVNTVAPFILIQNLLPNLEKHSSPARIINVSSMEGKFTWKSKPTTHPHTNMAKAALNMLTRTCGKDFRIKNIIMCAVDTGWNTIEDPLSYDKTSPIDCRDGAARVIDPIIMDRKEYGIFYKNFKIIGW